MVKTNKYGLFKHFANGLSLLKLFQSPKVYLHFTERITVIRGGFMFVENIVYTI